MERVKVKVLVNQYQQSLENTKMLKYHHGKDYDPDSDSLLFRIFGEGNFIEPIFNRVGYYCKGDLCWHESRLPSGRIVGTLAIKKDFNWNLKLLNAELNPISDKDWYPLQKLIVRKVIPNEERFIFESYRRTFKDTSIDSKKRIMNLKKRYKRGKYGTDQSRVH